MTPATIYRRAIIALRERVQRNAPVANLYQPENGGARSPAIVRAWRERQADLTAIVELQEMLRKEKENRK